ncbi:CPBP family glutamic-type intramembrane protease [Stigmatella erecta]|uniref:PDZ domain-containing protein n=1 Tax=Stigmatella erecta TaxID=83460 RepID=A0A1I0AYV9_9BACT|nr:CPBP family glutamic-type intramembrane protease [Stigmatella erecta]SES98825.1 PDZ domain-containing protein [Stigmatella erecta]
MWAVRDVSPLAASLCDNAPSRGRALAEAALVLATVFLPANLGALGRAPLIAATGVLALVGFALLRPWVPWRAGQRAQAVLTVLLWPLALGASLGGAWFMEPAAPPPRLGVTHTQPSGAGVELTSVKPGLPADGKLEVGDRILAVNGSPLAESEPELDFQTRVREAGDGQATTIRFSLERAGQAREVEVPVGPSRKARPFQGNAMTWLCIRALGMCLLVALLLWRNGQGPAQVGLVREGLGRELLWGLPVFVGTYAVHIAVSVPVAVLGALLKLSGAEMAARKEVASSLVETGLSVPAFALMMVLVTGFEELTFRGFLVPRLRVVLGGSWYGAVALAAALFGLGHVYEGTLAVFQTAMLGAWFGFVFIQRARLPSVMFAHAAFNTVNFALMMWLQSSGLLEKLSQMAPR